MICSRAWRWSVYGAIAVIFAIVCLLLSQWQFDRNQTRSASNALIEANYDATPVALGEALPGGEFDAATEWQPVTMTGTYLSNDQLLVRNRPLGGTNAFEVLVPFRTDDGYIIVVDRGWVAPAEVGEGAQDVPEAPTGTVTVTGRLRPGEVEPRSGKSAPDGQVATIHLPTVATLTGLDDLVSTAYVRMSAEEPAPSVAPHAIPAPEIDPGPHLSYAIQWILFAIMGFVFIGYMIRTEIVARREDQLAEDEDDQHAENPPRSKPRRPRRVRRDADAEAEDALLDATT